MTSTHQISAQALLSPSTYPTPTHTRLYRERALRRPSLQTHQHWTAAQSQRQGTKQVNTTLKFYISSSLPLSTPHIYHACSSSPQHVKIKHQTTSSISSVSHAISLIPVHVIQYCLVSRSTKPLRAAISFGWWGFAVHHRRRRMLEIGAYCALLRLLPFFRAQKRALSKMYSKYYIHLL